MRLLTAIAMSLLAGLAAAEDRQAGPVGLPAGPMREQLHWVPYPAPPAAQTALMLMRVCRPAGDRPAKLAVINHGSPPDSARRPLMQPTACVHEVTRWFLDRGFVVAYPMRRGYGQNAGGIFDGRGPCENPGYDRAGLATANDVQAAIAYAQALPFVRREATLVIGQSVGGWGSIALASRNPANVAALVNFAGGHGGHYNNQPGNNCNPEALIASAGLYGKKARRPMLWIYTANDSFFGPSLAKAMHEAFAAGGGVARLEQLAPFDQDGHGLLFGNGGSRIWGPIVERYLAEHNIR
ncbi:MAG: dienelactone hydrolase family protein [Rhodospirillales bacterium]|nr:dienelactone hydrolase family protein [Rhodospirillales bacterium]